MIGEMALIMHHVLHFILNFLSFAFLIFFVQLVAHNFSVHFHMNGVWNFLENCLWGMEFTQVN